MAQRGHKKSSRNSSSRLTAPEDSLHDAKVVGEQRMWGRPLKPKGTPAASAWGRTSLASSLHGARPVRPGLKTSPEENGGASEMGHQSVVQGRQKGKQSSKITANSNMTDTSQYSAVPSVSREKKAGKTVPGQKAVQNPLAAELVVASLRTGRPVRQKRGKRPHSEQSWSVHHSSQGLHGPQEEPPSKRSRYLNSQSSIVETDKRPLGKKSFLRRAQEDMLIPGSTSTEGNSETRSGSKAGLSGVQDISRPLTRHSVHGASSTRLQNYRYCGLDSRPGLGLEENRGRHQLKSGSALGRVPQISSVTDAGGAASGTPTQRRKRGRGMAQPTRSEDIGFDPGQRKVLGLEGRRAVQSAGQTRGRRVKKAVHHGHPHALSGVKLGQGEKLTDGSGEVHPVASCSRNLTSVHDRNDRPKRNLSKRKKCECCQFDEEHPDASFSDSDSEFQKSVGKDDDRAWRSSIRPSGNKLKGAAGRGRKRRSVNKRRSRGTAKDHTFSSDHHQQSHAATYAYPVQLHTSFFRQELPLLGSLHCLGKEDVKAETLQQKSDGAVKDEAEFPFNPQVCSYNQNAKLPGEVAYMQDDFYVVVAESDDDEDGTDVSSKDMSVDGIKGSAESAPHKEIPDSKEAFTPQKEHKNQASSSSQREGCVGKVDNVTGTSFSVQNENKENAPVIAQSDELHSQSERVLKSALMAQKSLHHSLKSPEEGLGVKKEEPCFLTGQVSEKEAEVCNAKEEPDSRTEEGSHTLTAETEESSTTDTSDRQVEQSPQTAVIAQRTEAGQIQAEPSVSSPESDKVQPSSAGTEDNNRTQSSQESSAGHPAGDRKEQAQDTQHVTGVGDETSAMQGHTAAPDEIPDKDCVVKGKTEQGDSNQDGETTDVASDQGTACTVTPGEDPQQVSLEHRGGAAGESALVTSPNKIPQLITRQEYPAVEYPPREEALQMSSPAKDSAVVATGEKVELIFQREDPMQDDDAVIIPAENPVQNDCAVITPAENPAQNDTVITPTENPAQNDTVITPTENPAQNDTVITPTDNPAQNDTVITPTDNPAQNDTVITPTENPAQNDTVITPTENPAQNDTVITPTDNPAQNDTVITPTENPAQNDTVITPTDNPAQNDTVITPTDNPVQNDKVSTFTEKPVQNDGAVIKPAENPAQDDAVLTPTENPVQNDGAVTTPTENPVQEVTVMARAENPVQADTVAAPSDQDQPDGPDHISAEEEKEVDTELCFHTSGHGDHQHRTNTATGVKGDLLVCGTTGGSSEENSQQDRMDCDTTAESFFKETYHVTAASKDGYHQGSQSVSKESHPVTAASKDGYHQSSESVSRLVL
ncbi:uncharacterized protein LOC143291117 [Babylonia areolata]|uniref:uncharacterized protein LOC143291117 n=1 Tax=Babylonia areolata TaxID=304850 RepID=UPI003FD5E660